MCTGKCKEHISCSFCCRSFSTVASYVPLPTDPFSSAIKMILFSVCLVAATFLWPALAMSGAPGDFQDVCTRHFPDPIPQGHRVIFDTWSYEKLFDGILATLNDDGGSGVSFK